MIRLNCLACNDFFLLAQRDFISDFSSRSNAAASAKDFESGEAPSKFLKFLASALQPRHSPSIKDDPRDSNPHQIPVSLVNSHWRWKPALILFVGSIIFTLLFWRALPAKYGEGENSDYVDYYKPVAESLLDGRGFVLPDGKLASRYPPGYPCLLAGLFGLSKVSGLSEAVVIAGFTLFCTALSVLLIYWLASMFWGIWPAGIAAGAWMSYPFLLWLTLQPHSETPFLVVFYASVCLFWLALRRRTRGWPVYFLLGCLLGIAMLIRPIALLLGFVFGLVLWLVGTEFSKRQRLFLASMISCGNLATVLPWEAWLYQRTGKVVLLSTSGVRAMRDGLTFAVKAKGFRHGLKVPNDVAELMRAIDSRYQELDSIGSVASLLLEQLKERPSRL